MGFEEVIFWGSVGGLIGYLIWLGIEIIYDEIMKRLERK